MGFDPVVRTIESVEVAEEPEQEFGVDDDEGVLLSRMASFQLGMQVEEEDEISKLFKACDGRAITGTSRRLLGSSSSIRLLRNVAASGLSYPCPSPFAHLQPARPVSPTSYAFIDRTRPLSLPPSSPPSPTGAPHSTTRPRPTLSQTTTYTSQGFLLPCQAERDSSHSELAHHSRSKNAATAVDSSFERIRDWRQVVASREMPECDLDRVSAKLREISSQENSLASVGGKGLQRSQTLADRAFFSSIHCSPADSFLSSTIPSDPNPPAAASCPLRHGLRRRPSHAKRNSSSRLCEGFEAQPSTQGEYRRAPQLLSHDLANHQPRTVRCDPPKCSKRMSEVEASQATTSTPPPPHSTVVAVVPNFFRQLMYPTRIGPLRHVPDTRFALRNNLFTSIRLYTEYSLHHDFPHNVDPPFSTALPRLAVASVPHSDGNTPNPRKPSSFELFG